MHDGMVRRITAVAMAAALASAMDVAAVSSIGTRTFHLRSQSQCAFITSGSSNQRARAQRRAASRMQLADNGGMDAYDAQMAAMEASSIGNQHSATGTSDGQASNESSMHVASSSSSSQSKWAGQNSYTQQLLQPSATGMDSSYSQYSTTTTNGNNDVGADAYAEQMNVNSRKSFVAEQQEESHSTASGDVEDPYEMEFTNYLLALQDQLDANNGEEASNEAANPSTMEAVSQQQQHQPRQSSPRPVETTAATTSPEPELTEEELQEKFLQMISNEVEYKKFLNQSPYSLTDIEWSVITQRFLDNLEDGIQKNNGKFKGESKLMRKSMPKEERKTVVILGSGWASHAFVKLASTYDLRIVVVSPVNHFVFTPMLASAAVGTVEYRSMTEPIRVTNPYIDNFVEGRAIGVDVEAQTIQVQLTSLSTVTGAFKGLASNAPCRLEPEPVLTQIVYSDVDGTPQRDKRAGAGDVIELKYDHLMCAVGTASRSSMVPGAKENCFNLKTSQDSKRLRTAIGEALENASRPDVQEFYYPDEGTKIQAREERRRRLRIAVVGGGPTGVELCGELSDFFSQVCRKPDGAYPFLREDVSITLVHGGSELLPSMDTDLRERALQALQAQGVDVRLNTRLKEVGQDYIRIGEKGSDVVETIPLAVTVWAAGNAPVPFVKELLSQLPESAAGSGGRINVDPWLRCPTPLSDSFGSILVLGDVACRESQPKYNTSPEPLPQTAQVAGQEGSFVARMLNRGYDMQQTPPKLPELSADDEAFSLLRVWLTARGLEEAEPFKFLSLGLLAYVGQEEALNQVMVGDVPLFNYSGKVAFVLWRSVYLAKQASSRNQALIAFDWLRTKEFGRDITRL